MKHKRHQLNTSDIEKWVKTARVDCAAASGPPHSKRLAWEPFMCRWLVQIDGREEAFKDMNAAVEYYNDH